MTRPPRIGMGLDSHRLVAGRPLILGGVEITGSDLGLEGHSDADALLHAVTDAILGAVGEGDIGEFFPPSDPRWKGVDSTVFLAAALERARAAGFRPGNVDTVVVTETPRLKDWKPLIRARLAELLDLPADAVGVKAKTAEGLGPIGERRLLEAHAVVLLVPIE